MGPLPACSTRPTRWPCTPSWTSAGLRGDRARDRAHVARAGFSSPAFVRFSLRCRLPGTRPRRGGRSRARRRLTEARPGGRGAPRRGTRAVFKQRPVAHPGGAPGGPALRQGKMAGRNDVENWTRSPGSLARRAPALVAAAAPRSDARGRVGTRGRAAGTSASASPSVASAHRVPWHSLLSAHPASAPHRRSPAGVMPHRSLAGARRRAAAVGRRGHRATAMAPRPPLPLRVSLHRPPGPSRTRRPGTRHWTRQHAGALLGRPVMRGGAGAPIGLHDLLGPRRTIFPNATARRCSSTLRCRAEHSDGSAPNVEGNVYSADRVRAD